MTYQTINDFIAARQKLIDKYDGLSSVVVNKFLKIIDQHAFKTNEIAKIDHINYNVFRCNDNTMFFLDDNYELHIWTHEDIEYQRKKEDELEKFGELLKEYLKDNLVINTSIEYDYYGSVSLTFEFELDGTTIATSGVNLPSR